MISSALLLSFMEAQRVDYISAFAGQVSELIKEIKSARQVLEERVEEAVDILNKKLPDSVTAK